MGTCIHRHYRLDPVDAWERYVSIFSEEQRRQAAAAEMRQIDPGLTDDEQAREIAIIRAKYLLK